MGGLILAIGLLKSPHIKLTIYEAAHHFGEVGAGVGFGPNSVHAIELIDPKTTPALDKVATSNLWESKQNSWFQIMAGQDLGSCKAGDPVIDILYDHGRAATVHRAHFLDEFVKFIPEGMAHFGKRLVDMKDSAEGGKHLKFKDGTEATHDGVIGCDGIKSEVRKYILGHDHPAVPAVFSGQYMRRALIPMDVAKRILGDELAENDTLHIGNDGFIITFPIDKGVTMNSMYENACSSFGPSSDTPG